MPGRDIAMAVLVAAVWGFNFVAMKIGVDSMPPLLLSSLRFVPVVLVLAVLRPPLPTSRSHVLGIGAVLGIAMFTLLYFGIDAGMPAGLASVVVQSQAMFTLVLSALLTSSRPDRMQSAGIVIATGGLAVAAHATAIETTALGFCFVLGSALAWAAANLLIARSRASNMLHLMLWMSLVPPVPLALISLLVDGPAAVADALAGIDALGIFALLYLGLGSMVLGYSLWGVLLRRHPAYVVAPFSLLVPFFGLASASLFLGEDIGPYDILAFAGVLAGLALVSLPDQIRRLTARLQPGRLAKTED